VAVIPLRFGTTAAVGPLDTVTVTLLLGETELPASGVVLMTAPGEMVELATCCSTGSSDSFLRLAAASS
jgi:hypothetical protein